MTPLEEWLDRDYDRRLTDQRARIGTAQLGGTFVVALAGGVLAAALQVAPFETSLRWSAGLAGLALLAVLLLLLFDDLVDVDVDRVLRDRTVPREQALFTARVAMGIAVHYNDGVVRQLLVLRTIALGAGVGSIVLSGVALVGQAGVTVRR